MFKLFSLFSLILAILIGLFVLVTPKTVFADYTSEGCEYNGYNYGDCYGDPGGGYSDNPYYGWPCDPEWWNFYQCW